MSIETKHHAPIVYEIYDEMKNYVGKKNAISAKELSEKFCLSQRGLREVIHTIRDSNELEKVIGSCNAGYYICTDEDCEKAIERIFRQAISTFKVGPSMKKKIALNGQGKLKLGDYYKSFVQSLGEIEE